MAVIEEERVVVRTPKRILSAWALERINGDDEYDTETLVREAKEEFRQNEEFLNALVEFAIPSLLPDVIRTTIHARRGILTESGGVGNESFEGSVRNKMSRWYEHVGDTTHKALTAMTKRELIFSAGQREQRAAGELRIAAFQRALASGLKRAETVGEHYTNEQLSTIWTKHFGEES